MEHHDGDDERSIEFEVEDLLFILPKMLIDMASAHRYRYLLATFDDERYLQFLAQPDSAITGEVMSNLYGLDWVLTAEDEDELRRLGFIEPVEGPYPNWWFRCHDQHSFVTLVAMMKRVVHAVFKEQPSDRVTIRVNDLDVPEGGNIDDYLVEKRGFYQQATDPEELNAFAKEIESLALNLDDWR